MIDKLTIRSYRPGDKSPLVELLKLNTPKYFAESEIEDFKEYLDRSVEQYFVTEMDGQIVGGGGINFEDNGITAKISWDFIDPKLQGRGVGRRLLQHRIEILNSMERVTNVMVRTSQLAYKFYEKNGFVLQETVKDYWAAGFDLYSMRYK